VPIGIGSNLVISAAVNGTAPMTLQWYKDGQPVPGANGATLSLTATSAFDAGQYVLVASNSYGSVTSSIVNVFPNTGGLLAYEGFDYGQSGSDVGGRNGGFGWAGSWQNLDGGSSQSSSSNLSAGASAPSGYDARSSAGRVVFSIVPPRAISPCMATSMRTVTLAPMAKPYI
jgi:hypothetical protein